MAEQLVDTGTGLEWIDQGDAPDRSKRVEESAQPSRRDAEQSIRDRYAAAQVKGVILSA